LLEQIRIWDQAEADNIKYGGELTAGDAGNRGKVDDYPSLLVPILEIAEELGQVSVLCQNKDASSWKKAAGILANPKFEKLNFKKIFNAYGDNIYYNDPDRANVYLGGGATPKNEQSIAYLLRNDVLTNVENLQAELAYLLKDSTSSEDKEQPDDLLAYASSTKISMDKYLELVPPGQMKLAQQMLAKN